MKSNLLDQPATDRAPAPGPVSTAEPRINVAINLENWRHLAPEIADPLLWFHQHLLDEGMGWEAASQALGYEGKEEGYNPIFWALKGTGTDYADIVERIEGYRKIVRERRGIIQTEFAENPISAMIWAGYDYAVANRSITMIEGDSGHGKTIATEVWAAMDRNNHGKTVKMRASSIGGVSVFLRDLCHAVGQNQSANIGTMRDAIFRSFNPHRMLIVDEAGALLPANLKSTPTKLEFLRELHDRTGCALALIATRRLEQQLSAGTYLFEQVLGRIGMSIRLPRTLSEAHFRPLVVQYFPKPSEKLLLACSQVANNKLPGQRGRLRLLSQILRLASRIASKKKTRLEEKHFFEALGLREQMMGETMVKEG